MDLSKVYAVTVQLVTQDGGVTISSNRLNVINVTGVGLLTGNTGKKGDPGADGHGVPVGGLTGEVLQKNSDNDFDTEWGVAAGASDANSTTKGILKLTGDLGGTADSPTVPGLTGKQPLDSDLTSWAALLRASGFDTFATTPSGANLAALLTSALPASKGGTGLTALSANIVSLLGAADYAAARTLLGLVIGTNVQAFDSDLSTIAGLTPTTNNFLQSKSSAWASRTPTQVTADLDVFTSLLKGLVPASGGGTSSFLRADGSWASPTGGSVAGALTGIIVAASNAPSDWTAAATYTCDGTADDVQIQSAITAAKSDGRKIYLSPGTFNIATTIAISGDDVTDSDNAISLLGAGAFQTNLVAGTNVTLIKLSDSCKVNIHDIMLNVNGSGAGIQSRAVTTSDPYRSFWNSSFKNILIRGNANQTNHTGWAMDLGSPFRSTFENIEAYNVGNGIKLFSENAAFNPGDCTFIRCFMELGLNANGIGYYLSGNSSVMNHCLFIICEAFAYGATATGIKMDGTIGTMWNRFIGTNLEQFTTVVDIVSGEGNEIDCNYIAGRDGTTSTIFKTEAGAYNNRLQAGFVYLNVSGTVWSDANTTTAQPNVVHDTKLYCDTGATATLTTVTGSVTYGNVSDGAGTPPAAWSNNTRVEIMTNKTFVAPALGTPASGVGTNLTGTASGLTAGNASKWATARNLAGNSVDGSGNVAFANKFIAQGTTDAGLSAAQFLGALGTGIVKNTTSTGVLSIAVAGDFPTLNQNTTGSAATLTTSRTIGTLTGDVTSAGSAFNGSANNSNATVVAKINGVSMAGLATGILKNTTTTGVPSIAAAGTDYTSPTGTETLTNKRINPRVITATSTSTPTPTGDTADIWYLSTLTVGATFAAPTGTPVDGQKLVIRVKSVAAQTLAWNAIYLASGVAALPTTSIAGKTITCFFMYDSTQTKWVLMAVDAAGY